MNRQKNDTEFDISKTHEFKLQKNSTSKVTNRYIETKTKKLFI